MLPGWLLGTLPAGRGLTTQPGRDQAVGTKPGREEGGGRSGLALPPGLCETSAGPSTPCPGPLLPRWAVA